MKSSSIAANAQSQYLGKYRLDIIAIIIILIIFIIITIITAIIIVVIFIFIKDSLKSIIVAVTSPRLP